MSEQPNDSSDPTSVEIPPPNSSNTEVPEEQSSSVPPPGFQQLSALPNLQGAQDYHRRQYALLQKALRNASPQGAEDFLGVQSPVPNAASPAQDQQAHQDPQAQLALLEQQVQQAQQDLEDHKVNMVRMECLALMAQLDHRDLLDLKARLDRKVPKEKRANREK